MNPADVGALENQILTETGGQMIWTEAAIARELDGHLWSMQFGIGGAAKVVDLLAEPESPASEGTSWSDQDYQYLYDMKRAGVPIDVIASNMEREAMSVSGQWGRRWHWRHKVNSRVRISASLEEISRAVRDVYKVTNLEFKSARRTRRITDARQVFYWVAKHFTAHSFPVIANYAGGKDHSTAIHGVNKITEQLDKYRSGIDLVLFDLGLLALMPQEHAA